MNKIISLFFLLFFINIKAQKQILDTVFVSTKKVTHLVSEKFKHVHFSDETILGSPEKIVFTDKLKELVLLRPNKSFTKPLVISVINEDGFYEITCIYNDIKALSFHPLKKENEADSNVGSNADYDLALKYIKNLKGWGIKRVGASDGTLTVKLYNTFIYDEKLFIKIELINSSNLNFEIGNYEFYIDRIKVIKDESFNINTIIPLAESDKHLTRLVPNSSVFKVFAFNEISIADDKNFNFLITEKSSERSLKMGINSKFLENARKLKKLR